ncbi:MAG: hypothetical protein ACI87O_001529 [Planctomycetota bacterium]|jgi:hypothetical protein
MDFSIPGDGFPNAEDLRTMLQGLQILPMPREAEVGSPTLRKVVSKAIDERV